MFLTPNQETRREWPWKNTLAYNGTILITTVISVILQILECLELFQFGRKPESPLYLESLEYPGYPEYPLYPEYPEEKSESLLFPFFFFLNRHFFPPKSFRNCFLPISPLLEQRASKVVSTKALFINLWCPGQSKLGRLSLPSIFSLF